MEPSDAAYYGDLLQWELHERAFPDPGVFGPADGAKTLRPHQLEALSRLRRWYALPGAERALYVSCCGSGKTLALYAFCEAEGLQRALWLFPNLTLLRQSLDEMREFAEGRAFSWNWHALCSDKELAEDGREPDQCITTRTDVLAGWLRDAARSPRPHWLFATYQSTAMGKVREAQDEVEGGYAFEVRVADEAHFMSACEPVGVVVSETYEVKFSYATLSAAAGGVHATRHLNATATPSVSMLGEGGARRFGRCVCCYMLSDAIRDNVVRRPEIWLATIGGEHVRRAGEAYARWEVDGLEAEGREQRLNRLVMLALASAALEANRQPGCEKLIAFGRTNSRCKLFEECAQRLVPPGEVLRVQGLPEMTASRRIALVMGTRDAPSDFARARVGLLVNCDALATGFNLPALGAGFFFDPRVNEIRLIQAMGRFVRLDPTRPGENQAARVWLPVYSPGGLEQFKEDADAHYLDCMRLRVGRALLAERWQPRGPWGGVTMPSATSTDRRGQPAGRASGASAADAAEGPGPGPRALAQKYKDVVAVLRVFAFHDPNIGVACLAARGSAQRSASSRRRRGETWRDHSDWVELFSQESHHFADEALSVFESKNVRSAQAMLDWTAAFHQRAARARAGSPLKKDAWWTREQSDLAQAERGEPGRNGIMPDWKRTHLAELRDYVKSLRQEMGKDFAAQRQAKKRARDERVATVGKGGSSLDALFQRQSRQP